MAILTRVQSQAERVVLDDLMTATATTLGWEPRLIVPDGAYNTHHIWADHIDLRLPGGVNICQEMVDGTIVIRAYESVPGIHDAELRILSRRHWDDDDETERWYGDLEFRFRSDGARIRRSHIEALRTMAAAYVAYDGESGIPEFRRDRDRMRWQHRNSYDDQFYDSYVTDRDGFTSILFGSHPLREG